MLIQDHCADGINLEGVLNDTPNTLQQNATYCNMCINDTVFCDASVFKLNRGEIPSR